MKVRYRRILENEIRSLLETLENANWSTQEDIKFSRPDADKVHPNGFYFFNISVDRTMVLIEFYNDRASIIWCGNHDSYESTFKNNKTTIRKWLQSKKLI